MKRLRISKYARYIAHAIRFTTKETGLEWPDDTYIITTSSNELAEVDSILGMKVIVADIPSSFDFYFGFPSAFEKEYPLQRSLRYFFEAYFLDEQEIC